LIGHSNLKEEKTASPWNSRLVRVLDISRKGGSPHNRKKLESKGTEEKGKTLPVAPKTLNIIRVTAFQAIDKKITKVLLNASKEKEKRGGNWIKRTEEIDKKKVCRKEKRSTARLP